ncbi:MAG: preprotein translocase subunit YajC [Actinomycetota bacterium]|nr:preprotein translocase subunit YajC [Actinomycetota bacterium]
MQGASSLIFLVVMVAIFYFLLIRPQKKRVEQHRQLVESIGLGDEIVTIGGLFGRITDEDEETFELEVALGTRVRLLKSAVARKVDDVDEVEDDDEVDAVEEEEDPGLEEVTGEEDN